MTEQERRDLADMLNQYDSLLQAVVMFLMTHTYIEWDVAMDEAEALSERETTNA